MIDPELATLVRTSVKQALVASPDDIGTALGEFGWDELVATDEAFAYTVLFEEQGRLGADTDALDVVTVAGASSVDSARVLWPLDATRGHEAYGADELVVDGIALRSVEATEGRVLTPVAGNLHVVDVTATEETRLGGMGIDTEWVRVHGRATVGDAVGSWADAERRARLAIAAELVGVAERMLEVAIEQVRERRQFGRPIGAYQAVRHRLAEAYSELAGARSLSAIAWEDGRPEAAVWAKIVAATAHSTVTKHATQVCGAIGLDEEHPLPRLVRRGFALDALLGAGQAQRALMAGEGLGVELPEPVGNF